MGQEKRRRLGGEHTPRRRPHAVVREDRRRTRKRAAGARVGIPRGDSLAPTNTKREREGAHASPYAPSPLHD